jgi:hypothetical protein
MREARLFRDSSRVLSNERHRQIFTAAHGFAVAICYKSARGGAVSGVSIHLECRMKHFKPPPQ